MLLEVRIVVKLGDGSLKGLPGCQQCSGFFDLICWLHKGIWLVKINQLNVFVSDFILYINLKVNDNSNTRREKPWSPE